MHKISRNPFRVFNHICQRLDQIMTAISDFVAKQSAFNDQLDAAVGVISAELDALHAEIVSLQGAGTVSPEDQAALDSLLGRSSALVAKVAALEPAPVVTPEVVAAAAPADPAPLM